VAISSCRECGTEVSSEAGSCPKCGVKNPSAEKAESTAKLREGGIRLAVIAGAVVIVGYAGYWIVTKINIREANIKSCISSATYWNQDQGYRSPDFKSPEQIKAGCEKQYSSF
jgi:ribosomal protein L40E